MSKAAAFSLAQNLLSLLAGRGISVHAVLAGPADTEMSRAFGAPKLSPEHAAAAIFDGIQDGEDEIFPHPMLEAAAQNWREGEIKALERQFASFVESTGRRLVGSAKSKQQTANVRTAHSIGRLQVLEAKTMDASIDQSTRFSYTTYIHSAPEEVWQGLINPAMTKLYWRHQLAGPKTFRSDWRKGSTWDLEHKDVGLVVSDPEQVILESDPYRRLAYTWHTFTPDWASEVGMDEATADSWRAEPRSKVAFDIEDIGKGVVKLTVTHEGFLPGSNVLGAISQGWPAVLSSLKTLLETGTPLP